jgi:hypothetical protein
MLGYRRVHQNVQMLREILTSGAPACSIRTALVVKPRIAELLAGLASLDDTADLPRILDSLEQGILNAGGTKTPPGYLQRQISPLGMLCWPMRWTGLILCDKHYGKAAHLFACHQSWSIKCLQDKAHFITLATDFAVEIFAYVRKSR